MGPCEETVMESVWYLPIIACTYSGELRLRPNVVRSLPSANCTRLESVSAALMNVNNPTMPNGSVTMPAGMLVILPEGRE